MDVAKRSAAGETWGTGNSPRSCPVLGLLGALGLLAALEVLDVLGVLGAAAAMEVADAGRASGIAAAVPNVRGVTRTASKAGGVACAWTASACRYLRAASMDFACTSGCA